MLRRSLAMACAVLLAPVFAPSHAAAQPADKRTTFTFSGPVSLPGVTLPAGEYLFRLADPATGREVIQVMKVDSSEPLGMFFSLRAQRAEAADEPEVRFIEAPAGMAPAIRTWWYPGESSGYEFIYPKEQARKLAQGSSEPVLTTAGQSTTAAETNTDDLTRLSANGDETRVSGDATAAAREPGGRAQQGTIVSGDRAGRDDNRSAADRDASMPAASNRSAASASTPEVDRNARNQSSENRAVGTSGTAAQAPAPASGRGSQDGQQARTTLPATASSTPAVLAIGIVALCAAFALWAMRTRRLSSLVAWRR